MKNVAIVAAIDYVGGFDFEHPYPKQQFLGLVKGHKVIMARNQYNYLLENSVEEGGTSIIPEAECFVITNRPDDVILATPVLDLGSINLDLLQGGETKAFFMGGLGSWDLGLQMAEEVYMAISDGYFGSGKFFRTGYLMEHFSVVNRGLCPEKDKVCFVTYKRKI